MIPNVIGKHHDVGALRAEILATGFTHAHLARQSQRFDARLQSRGDRFALTVRTTRFVRFPLIDADEEDFLVGDAGVFHISVSKLDSTGPQLHRELLAVFESDGVEPNASSGLDEFRTIVDIDR